MSRIHGKDTGPEVLLRKALWRLGLRYRIHYPIPGRPDLVFTKQRIAVFVDGCFWHGCLIHGVAPKSNASFWRTKIDENRERDRKVNDALASAGWVVLRIWEHDIEYEFEEVIRTVAELVHSVRGNGPEDQ